MEETRAVTDLPNLYYDSVEHLLWNPTWLGWSKPKPSGPGLAIVTEAPPPTVRARMRRLSRLEAPLHHNLQLFLSLAPISFVARLFDVDEKRLQAASIAYCATWTPVEEDGRKRASILELCQPDVFIEGPDAQIAVEIKSDSKSSLKQVLKYAALMADRGNGRSIQKLVLVAPYQTFSEFWKGKAYANVPDLKAALLAFNDPDFDRQLARYRTNLQQTKERAAHLDIGWLSLQNIRTTVREEINLLAERTQTPERSVYEKLLLGLDRELSEWPKPAARLSRVA